MIEILNTLSSILKENPWYYVRKYGPFLHFEWSMNPDRSVTPNFITGRYLVRA